MNIKKISTLFMTVLLSLSLVSCDLSFLGEDAGSSIPTTDTIVKALKDALYLGIDGAVDLLGADDGFYKGVVTGKGEGTPIVLLPDDANTAITELGKVKFDLWITTASIDDGLKLYFAFIGKPTQTLNQLVQTTILSMNRSAEKAVKEQAGEVFKTKISELDIQKAMDILKGIVPVSKGDAAEVKSEYAATEYLKKIAGQVLYDVFFPIIQTVLNTKIEAIGFSTQELWGYLVNGVDYVYSYYSKSNKPNLPKTLDVWVTTKAIDAIFVKVQEVEKKVRDNPTAAEFLKYGDEVKEAFAYIKDQKD